MSESQFYFEKVDIPKPFIDTYDRLFFLRNFFQKPNLFADFNTRMESRLAEAVSPLSDEEDFGEIETYEPGELSAQDIADLYATNIRPIVIRGFAAEHPCVKLWTPEYFRDNYGDFPLWYSSTENLVEEDGTILKDYVDHVLSGDISRAYLENLSDIFNTYPELHEQIGLNKIGQQVEGFATYHKISQLFIGGLGTGAVFHCANELNCFLNIYGKKQWTFVHPKYSLAMYSSNFNKGIFVGSRVKHNAPKRFLEANLPLYNRIPKLRITLEPGDLLLNPPWWWHAINNVSPVTIAVATRWKILTEYQRQNSLYDFVQSFREERLTLEGKKMADSDVVVPDSELRKKYVSYEQMGWKS